MAGDRARGRCRRSDRWRGPRRGDADARTCADPPRRADRREHHGVAATERPSVVGSQIVGLLSHSPDYGPLADPQRRASCLSGLGYSAATAVLGAQPVDMRGRPAVLMVLAADTPRKLLVLVVEPGCNSAHTGLLANTLVTRP